MLHIYSLTPVFEFLGSIRLYFWMMVFIFVYTEIQFSLKIWIFLPSLFFVRLFHW